MPISMTDLKKKLKRLRVVFNIRVFAMRDVRLADWLDEVILMILI